MAEKRTLRLITRRPEITNPEPCRCCRHGHAFATSEIVVRKADGTVLKRLTPAPGGFEEI